MKARRWAVLALAIAVEVAATLSLKAALEVPVFYVIVVLGYATALVLLAICLRLGMPIGVAYGIWGAVGVAATALLATAIFGEALTPLTGAGVALIATGVLTVEMGSQRAQRPENGEPS
ncbi:DMT family transporter [Agreia sp.]|uniref:DMT family transporter n=1 Tax=Agreia sp. TaxID=1872416 RepID=UPI0035BBAF99